MQSKSGTLNDTKPRAIKLFECNGKLKKVCLGLDNISIWV